MGLAGSEQKKISAHWLIRIQIRSQVALGSQLNGSLLSYLFSFFSSSPASSHPQYLVTHTASISNHHSSLDFHSQHFTMRYNVKSSNREKMPEFQKWLKQLQCEDEWLQMELEYATNSVPTPEKFANKLYIKGQNAKFTTLVVSLCNLTGWSADSISLKLQQKCNVTLTAPQVWDFNQVFMMARDKDIFTIGEIKLMQSMARKAGAYSRTLARGIGAKPMGQTARPVANPFSQRWSSVSISLFLH
jgi:hypothetical protein